MGSSACWCDRPRHRPFPQPLQLLLSVSLLASSPCDSVLHVCGHVCLADSSLLGDTCNGHRDRLDAQVGCSRLEGSHQGVGSDEKGRNCIQRFKFSHLAHGDFGEVKNKKFHQAGPNVQGYMCLADGSKLTDLCTSNRFITWSMSGSVALWFPFELSKAKGRSHT